jgi:kynurenine formamidase
MPCRCTTRTRPSCEELAAAGVHEFLFVCLPLTIAGATGSLVRPIAIA